MSRDLTDFDGLHEEQDQIPISIVAIGLPSQSIYAATGDASIFVNLSTGETRTTPAASYTAFVPYAGLKVPTLKPMDPIQIEFSNGDDFWGRINAAGDYSNSSVTIWQGQVDTEDQSDPDQFTFSGAIKFYVGQLVNVIRAYDIATLKVDPHPNANTIHLPRERYDQTRFRRCPPPNAQIAFGFNIVNL